MRETFISILVALLLITLTTYVYASTFDTYLITFYTIPPGKELNVYVKVTTDKPIYSIIDNKTRKLVNVVFSSKDFELKNPIVSIDYDLTNESVDNVGFNFEIYHGYVKEISIPIHKISLKCWNTTIYFKLYKVCECKNCTFCIHAVTIFFIGKNLHKYLHKIFNETINKIENSTGYNCSYIKKLIKGFEKHLHDLKNIVENLHKLSELSSSKSLSKLFEVYKHLIMIFRTRELINNSVVNDGIVIIKNVKWIINLTFHLKTNVSTTNLTTFVIIEHIRSKLTNVFGLIPLTILELTEFNSTTVNLSTQFELAYFHDYYKLAYVKSANSNKTYDYKVITLTTSDVKYLDDYELIELILYLSPKHLVIVEAIEEFNSTTYSIADIPFTFKIEYKPFICEKCNGVVTGFSNTLGSILIPYSILEDSTLKVTLFDKDYAITNESSLKIDSNTPTLIDVSLKLKLPIIAIFNVIDNTTGVKISNVVIKGTTDEIPFTLNLSTKNYLMLIPDVKLTFGNSVLTINTSRPTEIELMIVNLLNDLVYSIESKHIYVNHSVNIDFSEYNESSIKIYYAIPLNELINLMKINEIYNKTTRFKIEKISVIIDNKSMDYLPDDVIDLKVVSNELGYDKVIKIEIYVIPENLTQSSIKSEEGTTENIQNTTENATEKITTSESIESEESSIISESISNESISYTVLYIRKVLEEKLSDDIIELRFILGILSSEIQGVIEKQIIFAICKPSLKAYVSNNLLIDVITNRNECSVLELYGLLIVRNENRTVYYISKPLVLNIRTLT